MAARQMTGYDWNKPHPLTVYILYFGGGGGVEQNTDPP